MKVIKSYIKKQGFEFVDYETETAKYILCPQFIIFKDKESKQHYISFDIDAAKNVCINLYMMIQGHFSTIDFEIYDDCIMSVENGLVEYFCFGDEAKEYYYEWIHEMIINKHEYEKNVTVH